MSQAWIVRAGRDDTYEDLALNKALIAVGWSTTGDLTSAPILADIKQRVKAAYPDVEAKSTDSYAIQLFAFRSRMKHGDLVLLLRRNSPDVALGKITGGYEYRTDLASRICHVRAVRWLRTDLPRLSVERDLAALPPLTTVYRITQSETIARLGRLAGDPQHAHPGEPEPAALSAPSPENTTEPFANLQRNLNYARSLATAGQHLALLKVGAFEISDVFRAAWVQSVAALDHWVRQEIRTRMLELSAQPGTQKPKAFSAYQISLGLVEQVQAGTLTLVDALDQQLRDRGHLVYQSPDKIREGFSLVHEVSGFWNRVAKVLTEQSGDGITFSGTDVQQQLQQIAHRRHKIAHEYDEDPGDATKKRPIDAASATQTIDWIEQLAAAILVVLDTTDNKPTKP
ncbi:restriction endonuclease [Micromonospora echinospora]|uniref:restriction endonuclease n=1 Tax=Micromonospora echinospora TaxID=1877 RepID=UPI003670CEDD